MNKIYPLLCLAALITGKTTAQITKSEPKKPRHTTTTIKLTNTIRNEPRTKTVAPTPPPPPPVDKTVYYLRAAKVDFITGNDNKELQSRCDIMLTCPGGSPFQTTQNDDPSSLLFCFLTSDRNRQEFRPNSTNRVDLPCLYQFPGPYEGWR